MTFNDPAWLEEERRLLGELRRGDRTAFSRLYRAFAQPLYARVLLPKLGDRQAAEDVAGGDLPDHAGEADQYEDRGGSIWSWLATVAANKARDVERERARRGQALRGFALLSAPLLDAQAPGPGDDAGDGARLQAAVARVMDGAEPALPARADAAVHRGSAARRMRGAAGGQGRDVRRAAAARAARVSRALAGGRRRRHARLGSRPGDGMKPEDEEPTRGRAARGRGARGGAGRRRRAAGGRGRRRPRPADALETAALLRHARAPLAVPPAHEPIAAAQVAPALDARRARDRGGAARGWLAALADRARGGRRLAAVRDDVQPAAPRRRPPTAPPAPPGGSAGRAGGGDARRRQASAALAALDFEDARLPAPVSRRPAPPRRRRAMIGRRFARLAARCRWRGCSRSAAAGRPSRRRSLGGRGGAPARARRRAAGGGRPAGRARRPARHRRRARPRRPPGRRSPRRPPGHLLPPGAHRSRRARSAAPPSSTPSAASRSGGAPATCSSRNLLVVRGAAHEALGEGPAAAEDYHQALVINDELLRGDLARPRGRAARAAESAVNRLLAAVLLLGACAAAPARNRLARRSPREDARGDRRSYDELRRLDAELEHRSTRRRPRPTARRSRRCAPTSARSPPASARSPSGSRPDHRCARAATTARRAARAPANARRRAAACHPGSSSARIALQAAADLRRSTPWPRLDNEIRPSQVTLKTVFTVAFGVLIVIAIVQAVMNAMLAVALTGAALLIAVALDHPVRLLERRGVKRPLRDRDRDVRGPRACSSAFGFTLIPPAIEQGKALVARRAAVRAQRARQRAVPDARRALSPRRVPDGGRAAPARDARRRRDADPERARRSAERHRRRHHHRVPGDLHADLRRPPDHRRRRRGPPRAPRDVRGRARARSTSRSAATWAASRSSAPSTPRSPPASSPSIACRSSCRSGSSRACPA